jgi:predicted Zn-dependent peptidase
LSLKNIKITTLENGIKVISERIKFVNSFSLGFWFNVGSADETEDVNGISHFLEHMFFKGTVKRSAKKIAEDVESLGAYLNAFTSKEHTCFYGRGLNIHMPKIFEVLADMVQNSLFKPSDISKESGVVIDELYDIEDSPEELIFDKFESNVFNGNTIGMPIIGTVDNLKKFKRKDLQKYVDENCTLDRMFIVASGNIDHTDLIKLAKKFVTRKFKSTNDKKRSIILQPSNDLFVEKETQQTHFILGKPTYGYKDKERVILSVMSHILGEGSSSRLFQKLREENGITYQINSFLNSFYDMSTFGVYLSTNEKTFFKAQKLVYEEIKKIKSKLVSNEELERAKQYLIGNMLLSLESVNNRQMRIAQSYIYFGKIKSTKETIDKINAVSKKEIINFANELFENGTLTRVILSQKNLLLSKAA